jgi:hypothetical protein
MGGDVMTVKRVSEDARFISESGYSVHPDPCFPKCVCGGHGGRIVFATAYPAPDWGALLMGRPLLSGRMWRIRTPPVDWPA